MVIFSQSKLTTELRSIKNPLKINEDAIWLKNKAGNILGCRHNLIKFYEDITIMSSAVEICDKDNLAITCLLYTSPSPRDRQKSRMPSSA